MSEPSSSSPWLSVVIPAYNEAQRLGRALQQIRDYADRAGRTVEVVVVDDGSTDGTAALAEAFEPGPLAVEVLRTDRNRGKGHAVRQGVLAARGEVILMSDADQSTPIHEVGKLLAWIDRGWDVAIGSRDMPDSILSPPQPWFRHLPGWILRAVRRRLMLPDIRDSQCGFKLFRRDAGQAVFRQVREDGFLFDCEVLGLAHRMGYRIREVGVVWCNDPDSRVRMARDLPKLLVSLVRIVWRLRRMPIRGPAKQTGQSSCEARAVE